MSPVHSRLFFRDQSSDVANQQVEFFLFSSSLIVMSNNRGQVGEVELCLGEDNIQLITEVEVNSARIFASRLGEYPCTIHQH